MLHSFESPRTRSFVLGLIAIAAATGGVFACKATPKALIDGCDPTSCAKDNQCIGVTTTAAAGAKVETACRLTCSEQTGPQGCPFGYRCDNGGKTAAGAVSYCAALSYAKKITKKAGQWGSACSPINGGLENTDCDAAQGFKCFAKLPTDGDAFCTTYDCTSDNDCPGAYSCATINAAPNADVLARTVGEVRRVCLPRNHCTECASDLDCGPTRNGVAQKCVADSTGKTYCAATCDTTANCPDDAVCNADVGNVCTPTVGRCASPKGEGGYCDPCKNDTDCKDGVCISSDNSTERFCGKKSAIPCEVVNDKLVADCPAPVTGGYGTSCSYAAREGIPKDYCYGLVLYNSKKKDDGPFVGCYSRSKR
jgi:hypothetical protein